MKSLALVLVFLGWIVALPVSAQGPRRSWEREPGWRRYHHPRDAWVYSSGAIRGRFVMTGSQRWQEENQTGRWFYDEVSRTPWYVELYDRDRDIELRLYGNRLYQRTGNSNEWQPGYVGRWR
jgi:hypothetical protein